MCNALHNETEIKNKKPTHRRYYMIFLVCLLTALNYIDRANLAVTASTMQQELAINPLMMGVVFSAFGWVYAAMQIPGGILLDRFGNRVVYSVALFGWSVFTGMIALVNSAASLIGIRAILGFFESPAFPANGRIVTLWLPQSERGLAIGAYTASEYLGLAFCTPFLSWILTQFGWNSVFVVTGMLGIFIGVLFYTQYRDPKDCSHVNQAELDLIKAGGGIADSIGISKKISWKHIAQLFQYRQLVGLYIGQFAITATVWFFLTWFPSYLVMEKHMEVIKMGFYASVPYIGAICGVLIGGKWSDWMIETGYSVGTARKLPVIIGFILSGFCVFANYTDSPDLVIACMTISFFGIAIASGITWALLTEIAPKENIGIAGGVMNFISNLGAIVTPLAIGIIYNTTHSFVMGLSFIGIIGIAGALSFIFIVGKVYRIQLKD